MKSEDSMPQGLLIKRALAELIRRVLLCASTIGAVYSFMLAGLMVTITALPKGWGDTVYESLLTGLGLAHTVAALGLSARRKWAIYLSTAAAILLLLTLAGPVQLATNLGGQTRVSRHLGVHSLLNWLSYVGFGAFILLLLVGTVILMELATRGETVRSWLKRNWR